MSVHFTRAGSSPRIPALRVCACCQGARTCAARRRDVAAVLSAHAGGRGPHGTLRAWWWARVAHGLGDEAVRAAAGVDRASWHDVGGVETYEE